MTAVLCGLPLDLPALRGSGSCKCRLASSRQQQPSSHLRYYCPLPPALTLSSACEPMARGRRTPMGSSSPALLTNLSNMAARRHTQTLRRSHAQSTLSWSHQTCTQSHLRLPQFTHTHTLDSTHICSSNETCETEPAVHGKPPTTVNQRAQRPHVLKKL